MRTKSHKDLALPHTIAVLDVLNSLNALKRAQQKGADATITEPIPVADHWEHRDFSRWPGPLSDRREGLKSQFGS